MNEEDLEELEDLVLELGEEFVESDARLTFALTAQKRIESFIYELYQAP